MMCPTFKTAIMNLRFLFFIFLFYSSASIFAQQRTYCNPINIDYGYTPFEQFSQNGKHRTTADPSIVRFRDNLFLFSTNQEGYWYSKDMLDWTFVSRRFLLDDKYIHDLNAPDVWVMGDTLYVYGSTWEQDFPIWKSTNPTQDDWEIAVDTLKVGAWDPAFFYDKDRLYLYWGSSNEWPVLGTELNVETLQSEGFVKPVLKLQPEEHGWERMGEYNDGVAMKPFIEGAWMTRHDGKYYLQYGSPNTESKGYADGVYVSDDPLGEFTYQSHNPFSYKPGGFARGSGHGSTFQDKYDNYWHTSTIVIGVKNNFERRIGIWPAGFDKDGVLYSITAYGDYPTLLPEYAQAKDFSKGLFAGWMLLNYNKPVQASSTLGGHQANFAVDENLKTYWSAETGDQGEWFQTDLGEESEIRAIQVNYADQDADFMGKTLNKKHQYKIYASTDGQDWKLLIDKSNNQTDVPHDYIELETPEKARFLKMENIQIPTGKFALSGFRVFGKGSGESPQPVENLVVLRAEETNLGNRASVWFQWKENDQADGYVIYWGKSPEKLYGSIMVYGKNEYYFTGADINDPYYFQVEAFNNNGISERSKVVKVE